MAAYRYVANPSALARLERWARRCAGQLGCPAPRVRLFREAVQGEPVAFTSEHPLNGICRRDTTIDVRLRALEDMIETAAHEVFHVAQMTVGYGWACNRAGREEEARHFAARAVERYREEAEDRCFTRMFKRELDKGLEVRAYLEEDWEAAA